METSVPRVKEKERKKEISTSSEDIDGTSSPSWKGITCWKKKISLSKVSEKPGRKKNIQANKKRVSYPETQTRRAQK